MSLFEQNLALLRTKDPRLSERMILQGTSGGFRVVPSRSGLPTILYADSAGEKKFLHSPLAPSEEAKRQIEGYRFDRNDGTILYGFGLGYLALEIVRHMEPGHVLFVVECIPEIFKLAMTHLDLAEILAHDRALLFVGEEPDHVIDRFLPIQQKILTGRIHKLIPPPLKALCPSFYDEIDSRIDEHVFSIQVSFSSFEKMKSLVLSNLFRNIPDLLHSSPVDHLRGLLEKRPVLVVSAGPSLDRAVEAIREYGRDCVIITVDAAVKPLVRNGVMPHMVVNCDPYPINENKISGLPREVFDSAALAYQADGCPEIIGSFTGRRFFLEPPNTLGHWLVHGGRSIPAFPAFQGTSHLAFLMARLMGADPIVLVGLDLSFPEDRHHAEGCGQTWSIDCSGDNLPLIPSNDGGSVKTAPVFMVMLRLMEREVLRSTSRCINVSRHGALITGTEPMGIEEVLKAGNGEKDQSVSFARIWEDVPRPDPVHLQATLTEALQWMDSEAKTMMGVVEGAGGPFSLRRLYSKAQGHSRFLKIISDFLPRTMISGARHARPDLAGSTKLPFCSTDEETLTILIEEIRSLLPELLSHSREALSMIQSTNRQEPA